MAYKRNSPQPVAEGGTGAITNTAHGILLGQGTSAITAQTLTDGQLLIGKTGAFDSVAASLASAGSTITITPGAGSINLETAGSIAASFPTDAGTATPAVGAPTVAGGTNTASAGAGSTVTLNLDAALTGITSVTAANGGSLQTGTTAGDTLLLKAYNNTGASYSTFATLTANLTPTFDLNTATTINSAYIYRAGGTDVPVTDGGTGVSTLTPYAVICGGTAGTNPVQSIAGVGTAGQVLTSNGAAALPTFQAAAASGIVTLNGDTGSATGATVTVDANTNSGSTVKFSGAAATLSLNISDANNNTIIGKLSGNGVGAGTNNTAFGYNSLHAFSSGTKNTAIGLNALKLVSTGSYSTGVGIGALGDLTTGISNIAIGRASGGAYTGAESSNICIGNGGTLGESHTIHIGITGNGGGEQNNCYIAGITGVNVGSVATVVSHSSDHLGSTTITAGTGISVTPGANTITIANTAGAGFTWAVTTVDAGMVVANGYIANKAGLLTMTLPATAAIGDILEITNMNTAVGWRIAQNANQYIRLGNNLTTVGVGGYLEATALGDSVKLVCMVAGASTGWIATSVLGNVTIV